ncbi:phosphoribosylformylglycinamidine synthase, partial [Candidatus Gottesmanbacteria bacterium]|nr:phosphoribosylformylglycinamidine synthase [Candidatus Gottesmanbacteria bacterium]
MIHRLLIDMTVPDTRAGYRKAHISSLGFPKVQRVRVVDVYTVEKQVTNTELKKIGSVLSSPVSQSVYVDTFFPNKSFDWAIEIGFLPGVTDNVATTAKECAADLLNFSFESSEGVYTSTLLFLTGSFSRLDVEKIALSFANPLIERVSIKSCDQYKKDRGMDAIVPRVNIVIAPHVDAVNINVPDAELVTIGKQGIKNGDGERRGPLALDLSSMKAIQKYFSDKGRNPTDVEVESIAQTWSEHCKHTIFSRPLDEISDGLYKHYIKRATEEIRRKLGKKDFCVSVFTDNSGAIAFDKNYLITHKVETHNSPSALDPFGGSITGIVGVNRDAIGFGLGAKPAANTYGFCFANSSDMTPLYKDKEKFHPLLSPKRIMDGVIAGVNSGGNCSGIPTPQGFLYVDPRYKGKPLVFVGTVGLIPNKKRVYEKRAKPGDFIVMVGGRVGIDGIHGATFSSEALTSGSPATAVQIGDPITQKKLSDMLIKEARDMGLYTSITDNGAGGLSCSVAEMAKECGGFVVSLEKVPLKYPGLSPWQIWISESQERMTLSVPKSRWKKLKKLSERRGVEATVIGTFTKKSQCTVLYHKKIVMDMSMKFLHYGLPTVSQQSEWSVPKYKEPVLPQKKDLTDVFLQMVSRPNVSSFEWISSQYDHEVQGTSVLKPLQGRGRVNGDASVIRPVLTSRKGVALSQALYPNYSDIDTYTMAASSIDTAIRNLVTAGADPNKIALVDNFCWCSSKDPFR